MSDVLTVVGSITIGEARIPIDITHTWIGDLTVSVTSPAATAVTLSGAIGGAADDMLLTFADAGFPNDPADLVCGCLMQTDGSAGTLADFNTETSDGDWILDVVDGAAGDDGTVNEWCVQAFVDGCPGSMSIDCLVLSGDTIIDWTLPGIDYTGIEIFRDGVSIATLGGGEITYTDVAPGFGDFTYEVVASSPTASCERTLDCTVSISCPTLAVTDLTCVPSGDSPADVDLTWTNNGVYASIDVSRDGVSIATLGGGETTYTDLGVVAGTYLYEVTANDGTCDAVPAPCVAVVACGILAPTGLTCTATGSDVDLTWVNEDTYTDIEIVRGGVVIDTIAGTETTYTDPGLDDGLYAYQVRGIDGCGDFSAPCIAGVGFACADLFPDVLAIPDGDPLGIEAEIDVVDPIDLTDLNVTIGITHTFNGDISLDLTSPDATTVRLYDGGGIGGVNIAAVFTDNGLPHVAPFNVGAAMQVSGPGFMSDFRGDTSTGIWTLLTIDDLAPDVGTLDLWCLSAGCETPVPDAGITCEESAGDVTISWTNPVSAAYTGIEVFRDGVSIATLLGTDEMYVDVAVAAMGVVTYEVVFDDTVIGCSNRSSCEIAVGLGFCNTDALALDAVTPTSQTTTVTGVADITDPIVRVTLTHGDPDALEIELTSPEGTTVLLFDYDNLLPAGIGTLSAFRDGGDDIDVLPFGAEVQPRDPLSSFAGEDPNGDWTLTFTGLSAAASGTLTSFCIDFGDCALLPPSGLTCTQTGDDVDLAWTNNDTYDSVEVYKDGALLSTELGGAESFTDFAPTAGPTVYQVIGISAAAACNGQSARCTIVVGDGFTCNTDRGVIVDLFSRTVDVTEDELVSDAAALVDVRHDFAGPNLVLELTSPSLTTVSLVDTAATIGSGLDVTFGGSGVPFGDGATLEIDGGEMLPSGPGTMGDFDGEGTLGLWTFDFDNSPTIVDVNGIFISACIDATRCEVVAPSDLICLDTAGDVELAWTNNGVYGEVRIERNGVEITVLGGAETTFIDVAPPAGFLNYQVFGTDAIPATCERASEACSLTVGFADCSGAGETITAGAPVTSDLVITATGDVLETEALLEISHTFVGDLVVDLVSPTGTSVALLENVGGAAVDIAMIVSDDGIVSGDDALTCLCRQAPTFGLMSDYFGAADGTWSLTVTDLFLGDDGTLDNWCLELVTCDVVPPSELLCTPTATDVTLDWTNNDTYDDITILRDGVEVVILGGSETTYTDMPGAGVFEYTVVGNDATLGCGGQVACEVSVGLVCESPGSVIDSAIGPVNSTIEITGSEAPDDLIALVDISHTWVGDFTVDLENPDATATRLFDVDAGNMNDDVLLTFSDLGDALDTSAVGVYNTDEVAMPVGPGTMADLAAGTLDGTWTLTVEDTVAGDIGTLNTWCLNLPDTGTGGGPNFIRGDCDGNGIVFGLLDALYLLQFAFTGGPPLICEKAGDVDGNGVLFGLLDALYLLQFSFTGGPAPNGPFPDCGEDTADLSASLSCDTDTCTP